MIAVAIAVSTSLVRATEEQEETLADKLKKLFVRPTPIYIGREKGTANGRCK